MPLRSLLLHQVWLKAFSLAVAALIWLAVNSAVREDSPAGRRMTREFASRPVLLLTETAAHKAILVEPSEVNVLVQAPVRLLNVLKERDIQVFVRVAGRTSGSVPVRVHVPAGVTVSHVDPMTVTIRPADGP